MPIKFRCKLISFPLQLVFFTCLLVFSSLKADEQNSGKLDANGAAAILGETDGFDRSNALYALEPQIKFDLTGEEFSKILGNNSGYRSSMIQKLAPHAREGLEANEAVSILGEIEGFDRSNALRALEPKIKFGLSGEDFAKILGNNSSSNYRSMMVKILSDHAGDQFTAVNSQNKAGAPNEILKAGQPKDTGQLLNWLKNSLSAIPKAVDAFFRGIGASGGPTTSGVIGDVGIKLVPVAVEGLNSTIEVHKNQNRNLQEYVNQLSDGIPIDEVVENAMVAHYIPGRTPEVLKQMILEEAVRQGISVK